MTDRQADDILQMLGQMQGKLNAHCASCDKTDSELVRLWEHVGDDRERIVKTEVKIKGLQREVFRRGTAAGATAGGAAGAIIAGVYYVLHLFGAM